MNLRKYPEILALLAIVAFAAITEGRGYGHRPILLDELEQTLPAPPPKKLPRLPGKLSRLPERFEQRSLILCNRADSLADRLEQRFEELVSRVEQRIAERSARVRHF